MGHVQQIGTPLELYDEPANLFVASFIGLPPMNFIDAKVEKGNLVAKSFTIPMTDAEKKALASYEGKEIVLGFRPENTCVSEHFDLKVTTNENLGMNTLVHGHIGADGKGERITCKLSGWCTYKPDDVVSISITRKHFFDKETTNAIKVEV
jgi:multiple sugar transport system ATP-binding protein